MKAKIVFILIALCITSCVSYNKENVSEEYTPSYDKEGSYYNDEVYTKLYEVKTTDTLISVARKNHTTPQTLVELNNLKKPYTIKAGQLLKVPTNSTVNTKNSKKENVVHITPKK